VKWLGQYIDVERIFSKEYLIAQITNLRTQITTQSVGLLGAGILAVVQALLVLFTTYYLLRDGGNLLGGVRMLLPLTPQQSDAMINNVRTIISASLKGTLLIALIQGILGGIAFWFLGLSAPPLWAAVMFVTSLIPVVGSSIIWVPAALYLLMNGFWIKAIILVIWGVGVIAMVDNILRPVLVGSKTRMHELTVFFSVLGGIKLFGPVGIVAGPIVVAVAQGLLRIFFEEAKAAQPTPAEAQGHDTAAR